MLEMSPASLIAFEISQNREKKKLKDEQF